MSSHLQTRSKSRAGHRADVYVDGAMPARTLGLVVLRGPNIALVSPTDGSAGSLSFVVNPIC